jgi:hypothetical protein
VIANVVVPIDQTVFTPCVNNGAGENITLAGPLHVLLTVNIAKNRVQFKSQANPQDVFGTGSVTGARYKATGITLDEQTFNVAGFPAEETFVNNFRMIAAGRTSNLLVHETFHITINANGATTVVLDHGSFACGP